MVPPPNDLEPPRRRALAILVWLGALLAVAGIIALVWSSAATLATVLVAGLMLVAGGLIQLTYAYHHRGGRHPLGTTLIGILYVVVGVLLVARPGIGAVALTLLLGAFFWVAGLSRIAEAFVTRAAGWGWTVASGLTSVLLGVVVFLSWPVSALWLIGILVGVDLVVSGATLIGVAFRARDVMARIMPEPRFFVPQQDEHDVHHPPPAPPP